MTTHGMTMFCIGFILGIATSQVFVWWLWVRLTKGTKCNEEETIAALERTLEELKRE